MIDAPVTLMGVPPGSSVAALVGRDVTCVGAFCEERLILGVDLDEQTSPGSCLGHQS